MTKKITCLFAIVFLATAMLGSFPGMALAEEMPEETPSGEGVNQYIALDYLKRIDDTCFAEKVQTYVNVPVYENHVVKVSDVKKALGLKSFGVMQSYVKEIVYDEATGVYTAVYFKSVYLNTKTVDGNSNNYYLDCNLSFADFFSLYLQDDTYTYTADDVAKAKDAGVTIKQGETVNGQILDEGCYEYFWNTIQNDKIHGNYQPDEIYGYWGLVAIPETHTLNALWSDLFGTATNYLGEMKSFLYTKQLTWGGYKRLLNDYGYGFLERTWEAVAGFFTSYSANFYILYIDSEETEFMIAENGADDINDNHGTMFNGIEDVVDKVKAFFADKGNVIKIIIIVAVVILIIVLVAKVRKKE